MTSPIRPSRCRCGAVGSSSARNWMQITDPRKNHRSIFAFITRLLERLQGMSVCNSSAARIAVPSSKVRLSTFLREAFRPYFLLADLFLILVWVRIRRSVCTSLAEDGGGQVVGGCTGILRSVFSSSPKPLPFIVSPSP